jgi:hypothetical protein
MKDGSVIDAARDRDEGGVFVDFRFLGVTSGDTSGGLDGLGASCTGDRINEA